MKRYLFLFILFLLPAQAFLENLSDSDKLEDTIISGLCDETYVLLQYSQDDDIVGVETVDTKNGEFETTFVPDEEETYTIFASCAGDVDSVDVCYGDCGSTSSDSSTSSDVCIEYADCSDWGECIDGQRTSTCTFVCSGDSYDRFTDCTDVIVSGSAVTEDPVSNETCSESWSCKQWGECIAGTQTRECNDYNLCGTTLLIPDTTQSCVVEEPYVPEPYVPPTPVTYQEPVVETVYVPVEPEIVTVPAQTIDYRNFAIVGGIIVAVLIFIALSVMIVMHYMNAHSPSSNDDEMIEFVKQERRAGIDEEQIRASLKESGWHKDEIQHALDDTKDAVSESKDIAREGFEPPTSGL